MPHICHICPEKQNSGCGNVEIKRFIMRNLLMRLWRLASPKSYAVDQVAGDPAEV